MSKIWKIELAENFSGTEIWCEAENIEEAIEKYKKQTRNTVDQIIGVTMISSGKLLK